MSCENDSEEIREFIHNMLQIRKTHGLLLCGSTFEMPIQYVLSNISDMDIMHFPLDICALPADYRQTPNGFQGKILRIRYDNSHPGFARLHDENQSPITYLKQSISSPLTTYNTWNNPAYRAHTPLKHHILYLNMLIFGVNSTIPCLFILIQLILHPHQTCNRSY